MELAGSVIIVTGASSGIGLATARMLSGHGAKVVLVSRNAQALERLSTELPESFAVTADMTDEEGVRAMVAKAYGHYGRIDGLVNNAGRGYAASLEQIETEAFAGLLSLNVLGPVIAMQEVIPHMRANGGGAIVNVSSGVSLMRMPLYAAYSATKRALNGISLTAREELGPDNITVSLVYPSVTATDFGKNKLVSAALSRGSEGPSRSDYSDGDSPEYIAGIITTALREGGAEYFAHERMRSLDNR